MKETAMPASATVTRRKARPKAAATTATRKLRSAGRSAGRSGPGGEATAARASAGGASRPTSLKLPAALKARIDDIASREGLTPHAFMLGALAAATERAYLREQFQHDAQEALSEMNATGMGHALGDVRQYFAKLADFRNGKGPKPRRPVLTKTV